MKDPYLRDAWEREYYDAAPLGVPCEEPGCEQDAVRLECNAEGIPPQTHPHGGIHRVGKGPGVFFYCEEHGQRHLRINAAVVARKRMEGRAG